MDEGRHTGMKTELEIKKILRQNNNPKKAVIKICAFMDWDKKKLLASIKEHGTSNDSSRSQVIRDFWGDPRR